ncbi:hypothetical protein SPAN111604_08755 [Sphingomonas antarctica]|uniref:hypothetical protein n=1 Tax=Sphingomonas antarctica TaxID=2040274 RepID=UPI0039E90EA9
MQSVHDAVIAAVAAQLGPLAELNSVAVPWFSATFEGIQHTLRFGAVSPASLTAFEAGEVELACPDHVIVSLGAEQDGVRARVDVLTIACA